MTNVEVAQVALIRLASVTHSTNNDQRGVPLTIASSSGTTYTLAPTIRAPRRSARCCSSRAA
jgi:hypothetical protein